MNLPNKLTILRVILVPFFVLAILLPDSVLSPTASSIVASCLFILSAITDFIDGKIARKRNIITNFGKFMDPLADKFMIISALVAICVKFTYLSSVLVWITLLVIFRELAVTSLRLLASSSDGTVIAASKSGKVKTAVQCFAILAILLENVILPFPLFTQIHLLSWIAIVLLTFFTIYSGIEYFIIYKDFLNIK